LAACGTPGSSGDSVSQPSGTVSTGFDTSKQVTLTMWDTENATGPSKAEDELIQQFEQKYPNVTVKRVVKNFDDYMATIKLAASSSDAPDVFQGNEGAVDRALVKAHLITPLDGYAKAYGWDTRFGSSAALNPLRWSSDGSQWGVGQLWGIAQKAEVVGAFYNKATLRRLGLQVPTTFDQFQQSLAVAKSRGVPPIMVGNLDRWPMGHVFMVLQARFDQAASISNWTYGHAGATFDTAGTRKAATVLQQWSDKGYFEDGFNGVSQENAAARFGKGEGLYFITGPWENQTFAGPLGDGVGFFPLPSLDGTPGAPTTGALSLPFHISSHSQNQAVAAAFINFITDQNAAKIVIGNGDLPAANPGAAAVDPKSSLAAISAAWSEKAKAGTLTPYLDWATPTMGDTLFGGLQQLSENRETPADFAAAVQQDWVKTHS
ncbi:MAG TPA: extracellular solute-binding protein, partial [Gaiellales bacterium]|nr:extracellular solute-binding protein [Gaiellales bacterium]